jgi:hypothetical protein
MLGEVADVAAEDDLTLGFHVEATAFQPSTIALRARGPQCRLFQKQLPAREAFASSELLCLFVLIRFTMGISP